MIKQTPGRCWWTDQENEALRADIRPAPREHGRAGNGSLLTKRCRAALYFVQNVHRNFQADSKKSHLRDFIQNTGNYSVHIIKFAIGFDGNVNMKTIAGLITKGFGEKSAQRPFLNATALTTV